MPEQAPAIRRREFGQEQPLTVALHKLVRDYPLSVGLFKEFIQNADDAGASEVRFILDWRIHPSENLSHDPFSLLSGPSLLVRNDAVFQEADIENIQRVGNSEKAEEPSKIGRFGLGFNCCYNVTDHPLLLTGDSLFLFDPHKSAGDYSGLNRPGRCWRLDELWRGSSGLLAPFHAAGLEVQSQQFNATAFRLPLRTVQIATVSQIRKEACSPEMIRSLIADFSALAPSVLLFLKSVLKLSFEEIHPDSETPALLLSAATDEPQAVAASRRRVFSILEGGAEFGQVLDRIASAAAQDLAVTYEHRITVRHFDASQTYCWAVSAGFFRGVGDRLLTLARTMWERGEKAIPLAGVAALIPYGLVDSPTVSGEVFCFLPLPDVRGAATIPVHINGFFDVNSSRRGLTHEAGAQSTIESLRSQWNQRLIADGVAPAYGHLLRFILRQYPDIAPTHFYDLWLDPSQPLPEPLTGLVPAFYEAAVGVPLLRSARGEWVSSQQLRQVDPTILEPLVADRFEKAPAPNLPDQIIKGFSDIQKPIRDLTAPEVREFYRVEQDPACDLASAQRKGLMNRPWLAALTRFAFKDVTGLNPDAVTSNFTGLPFLLTADGKLHAFGLYSTPVFLASKPQRFIFATLPQCFIDAEHSRDSGLTEMPSLRVFKMTADQVVANLKSLSAPEEGASSRAWSAIGELPPNEAWLVEVFRYLHEQPAGWKLKAEALRTCCLIPDQFGQLWTCGLTSTPLLPVQPPSAALRGALDKFRVGVVSTSLELLAHLEAAHRRFPDQILRPLSVPGLADALAAFGPDFAGTGDQPGAPECETILGFLSSPEALDAYGDVTSATLSRLRALPVFPTEGGELVSLTAHQCYIPGAIHGPPVRFGIKLMKTGVWAGLLKKLGVEALTARALIGKVLLPSYPNLSQTDQITVLSWIRDHFDLALTEAGAAHGTFLADLLRAPLVWASDDKLRPCASLYFPGEPLVKEVMGEKALFPAMAIYAADRDRWLAFFERLGIAHSPRPQDLADYILFLLKLHADGGSYSEVATKLIRVLQHLIDHWGTMESTTVIAPGSLSSVSLREFLRTQQWCPPLRGQANLRHILVAEEPPQRFYRLGELAPPALGHLVGGVRPLLPISSRTSIPEGLRKLAPEVIAPSVEQVLAHFGKILDLGASTSPPDEGGLRNPLKHIYGYFGGLLGATEEEEAAQNQWSALFPGTEGRTKPAVQTVRLALGGRPCIYVPEEQRFRPAREVYRNDVSYLAPWRTQLSFKDSKADAGLDVLGRRPAPSFEDLCSLTIEIHEQALEPLSEAEVLHFLRLLEKLVAVWPDAVDAPQFYVLDTAGRLAPPSALFYNDADWLPEDLDLSSIPLAHHKLPIPLVKRAEMRLLSQHLKRKHAGEWPESAEPRFVELCAKLQILMRSAEFKLGLQRIVKKHRLLGPSPDLSWLEGMTINAMLNIRCEYYLDEHGGEISVGEVEEHAYWSSEDAQVIVVYLAEPAKALADVKLAELLKQQLHGIAMDDIYLLKMLGCVPAEIEELLDSLRLPKLSDSIPMVAALKPQEAKSDYLGEGDVEPVQTGEEPQGVGVDPDKAVAESKVTDLTSSATPRAVKEGSETTTDRHDTEQAASGDEPSKPPSEEDDHANSSEGQTSGGSGSGNRQGVSTHRRGQSDAGRGQGAQPRAARRTGPSQGQRRENAPKGRVSSYVLTEQQVEDAERRRDPADDEQKENKRIGDAAVGWVLQYERQQGRNPESKAHNNPGYDVESHAGMKPSRYIEVKGINGPWGLDGVPLSVRQFEFAKEKGEQFWLYVVEYAKDPQSVKIHPIQNPASKIGQFRFDSGWRQLATHEGAFCPVLPTEGMRLRFRMEDGGLKLGRIKSVKNDMLQVAWDERHHGHSAIEFDPLNVELMSNPA